MPMQPPTVIVLAAGRGERFKQSGGAMHKLDAMLAGLPVLERVLGAVAGSGLPCHVVRPEGTCPPGGMGDSIARGVAATQDAAGWLILPGDLPLIDPGSLLEVARALAAKPVAVPSYNGQPGHPVGFRSECGEALMALGGDRGAAAIVRVYRQRDDVQVLHLDDPGITLDIDTQDDLARAEAMLSARLPGSGEWRGNC
ncbi:nucleotidyltransferase family protein [Bordetella hinzii]|nr:nucleotidyltransferase family protein [Bordetella hinzii]QWF39888.1 nucleotidyltransferase family protein [Bordetella hinzii]QWF44435.1 nucleotidyltransferase family protein [Bordetella hinzii]QWF48971.1 nucleotidyltransferase family protein [Bordetella hinzii]QWF53508.1 nucleotidyltransferase family protein [Bordetella hinzii]QWF57997.1 nucleotidyltransferase family protein [Bordetella hinzii]